VRILAIVCVLCVAAIATAQPELSKDAPKLEVDRCGRKDPALTDDELRRRGAEHYLRGETLYLQGDYLGAVKEFVASYCLIPYYSLLKDIGQAFERKLDYERAIDYLERYVKQIPADAKRTSQCSPDPQEDKENVIRRVAVLRQLRAHINVQTEPKGAVIEVVSPQRVEARAISGQENAKDLTVEGGSYSMRITLDGYEPVTEKIVVQIGKPYTYFFNLQRKTGTLAVQVTPADSRIFLDDRLVGIGRFDAELPAKRYVITSERQGRITERREVEVLANQVKRVQVELTVTPQFGRRQLIVFSTIAGGASTGALLYAFNESAISGLGVFVGAGAALAGSYLYLDDDVRLGTSNITITSTLAGAVVGSSVALMATSNEQVINPITGASALIGGGIGFYIGERTKIRPGDAALINSSMTWGTVAGGLFALSFAPPREVGAGLVLSGIGMGGIGGMVMTRYFDISRTHALLIDIGGIVGILGGLAIASLVYPPASGEDQFSNEQVEHFANFSLGGMAVGLIGAGILTRNLDAPKLNLQPSIGKVSDATGNMTTTFGLEGHW
jgi:tetratricopeptide (TPR) repeat protein